ncbi:hypothetical protein [Pyrococcus kukulkanii]|uniref:DNA polymerase sliding clamp n=1 Tax=Pyrococcus kukulkanii TaxID=1609559 RepID=A0ABV4T845_9EURY
MEGGKIVLNGDEAKNIAKVLSAFLDDAAFEFKDGKVVVGGFDPSRVVYILAEITDGVFDEGGGKYGVNLSQLKKVLNRAKKKDDVTIEFSNDKIKVTIEGTMKRTFVLPIVSAEEVQEVDVSNLPLNAMFSVGAKELYEIIKDAKLVTDAVKFIVKDGIVTIKASGDINEFEATFDDLEEVDGEAEAMYSVSFLEDFLKNIGSADLTVRLGTEAPMVAEAELMNGRITFLLAPRVEE